MLSIILYNSRGIGYFELVSILCLSETQILRNVVIKGSDNLMTPNCPVILFSTAVIRVIGLDNKHICLNILRCQNSIDAKSFQDVRTSVLKLPNIFLF